MERTKAPGVAEDEAARASGWGAVNVQCPFWKGETRRAVVCEGLLAGERIRRIFPGQEGKRRLMEARCCRDYERCQIFQLVYGGYK
jgi:hypothetical protein